MAIPRAPRYAGSRVRNYGDSAQVTSHNNIPKLHARHMQAIEVAARAGALQAVKEAKAILRLQDIQGPPLLPVTLELRPGNGRRILIESRALLDGIQARKARVGLWYAGVFSDQLHPDSDLSIGALGRIHEYGLSGTKIVSEDGLGPHYFFGRPGRGIPARHWLSLVADDELGRAKRVMERMRNAYQASLIGKKDPYGLTGIAGIEAPE